MAAADHDHSRHTTVCPGSVADAYSTAKAARNDTSNKCLATGYRFGSIVYAVHRGIAKGAEAVTRAISEAVGKGERRDGTSGVDGPLGGGDHAHFDESGAKTSSAETHSRRAGLASHDGPSSVDRCAAGTRR